MAKKRSYLSQSDVPKYSLEGALKVGRALVDNFAGDPTAPIHVASAIDVKPSSSNFRDICGASIAYGITKGGYNANQIELAPLGVKILKPTEEGQDVEGLLQAGLAPRVLKEFISKYSGAKFPKDSIAKNVLEGMGVPGEKLDGVLEIIKENCQYLGLTKEIKGSLYVHVDSPSINPSEEDENPEDDIDVSEEENNNIPPDDLPDELLQRMDVTKPGSPKEAKAESPPTKPRVFITHGKNKKVVEQIKELLTFGQLEAEVRVEKETVAKSVPDKVFEDMRSCNAAVIHVENEKHLLDKKGNEVKILNSNVLIEIGAAMALYGKNFILLCHTEVELPSNLQGLYRCNYEGDSLDYAATMKLLKAFNDIRG